MRNMRKLKITKFLSWYYILSFLVIFGLGIYLYRGFRFVEGAETASATPTEVPPHIVDLRECIANLNTENVVLGPNMATICENAMVQASNITPRPLEFVTYKDHPRRHAVISGSGATLTAAFPAITPAATVTSATPTCLPGQSYVNNGEITGCVITVAPEPVPSNCTTNADGTLTCTNNGRQ
jgi:hypothetical protein